MDTLVHFPADKRKVIAVLAEPKIGEEVRSDLISKGWIPEKVKFHQGTHRDEQFQCEIWVTRAPA